MFRVVRASWASAGRSLECVELHDDAANTSATICPSRGAIAGRFRVKDRDIFYLDEDSLFDLSKNVRGGAPILFPSPGRLVGDAWSYDGKSGALKQHGFARNMPWSIEKTSDAGAATLTVSLVSNDATRAAFPWDFRVEMDYVLAGSSLRIVQRVTNKSRDGMPFGFGFHPYFVVTDKSHATIATNATRAFDNVTKQEVPFHGFDLTLREVDMHLLDHGSSSSALTVDPRLRIAIDGSPEYTRWVVWTLEGKDFVCVEPWTCPGDALNTRANLILLAPDEERVLSVEIRAEQK
jgi:galactose mutarotase-like enzyme